MSTAKITIVGFLSSGATTSYLEMNHPSNLMATYGIGSIRRWWGEGEKGRRARHACKLPQDSLGRITKFYQRMRYSLLNFGQARFNTFQLMTTGEVRRILLDFRLSTYRKGLYVT